MKRIASILLVILLICTMAAPVFAARDKPPEIIGMAERLAYGYDGDTFLGEIAPQDELVLHIDLTTDMFTWEDGEPPGDPAPLTPSQLRSLTPRVRAAGSNVVQDVAINTHESRIEIEFEDELVSTKEVDFEFDVTLSIDGRRQNDNAIIFSGTFANSIYDAYSGTGFADISDGDVIEAREFIPDIWLDVGAGVALHTRMMEDSRIYARAYLSASKDIYDTITLKTAGVPSNTTVYLGRE